MGQGVLEIPFVVGEDEAKCMRKLRKHTWTSGATAECHGLRLGVRATDRSILQALLPAIPPGARLVRSDAPVRTLYSVVPDASGQGFTAHVGPRLLARSASLDAVRDEIEAHVDTVLAVSTPNRVWIHAGVVAWRGRALVLPGASRAGKSTLVQALVSRGLTYYSDDAAVFDAWGRVHPYPRPISMRPSIGRDLAVVARRARTPRSGEKAIPVVAVVFTEFASGKTFAPRAVPAARAVLEMLGHALSARTNPSLALRVLGRISRRAAIYRGERGEADEAADVLMTMLQPQDDAPRRRTHDGRKA